MTFLMASLNRGAYPTGGGGERHERQQAKKFLIAEQRTMNIDVLTVIKYDMVDRSKSVIYTNARREALKEILTEWCLEQQGSGADMAKEVERDVYTISIGLSLGRNDTFCTQSDTGNRALTAGIVMDALSRSDLNIKSLEEMT